MLRNLAAFGRGNNGLRHFVCRRGFWLLLPPLVIVVASCVMCWPSRKEAGSPPVETGQSPGEPPPPMTTTTTTIPSLRKMVCPTPQTHLLEPNLPGVYQPTASGRLESALYGSTRTHKQGKFSLPAFHEGIDIAATSRDRSGHPLDPIYAIADGRVVHISRAAGNSNYGIYVVLLHEDPIGEVYSLYAHLASVTPSLHAGQAVKADTVLGVLGNTSTMGIPLANAHLHFEIGFVSNSRFADWFRTQKLSPDHGAYHGWNLLAIDPLLVLRHCRENPQFQMTEHLPRIPPAFWVVANFRRLPDFFRRYPRLWTGPATAGAAVLVCTENGLPLQGRPATDSEKALLGKKERVVLKVDEAVLGRNGARVIVHDGGQWRLGKNGEQWLEILGY